MFMIAVARRIANTGVNIVIIIAISADYAMELGFYKNLQKKAWRGVHYVLR